MCFYIGIEDLAANAMIEMLKKGGQRFLTYNEIEMNENKEVEDLIQQFRGYLALDVLLAFMNQRSVQVLGA